MRRVLLINPHFLTGKARYAKSTYHYYPTGIIYVASNLPADKYEVRILDLFAEEQNREGFLRIATEFRPDYVGISAYTENILSAFEIADILKKLNSNLKIIIGGPHASALPELTLEQNSSIDFVIAGEGEKSFSDLLNFLDAGEEAKIPDGVYCRRQPKNYNHPLIGNLDSLQFPEWGMVKRQNYNPLVKLAGNTPELPLITQRGCPYSCTFCYDLHGKKVRQRSLGSVFTEIDLNINRYGAKSFAILDEVFTFDRDRVMEFCRGIINNRLAKRINFGCSTRVDLLDRDLIKKMKEAGFNRMMIGIESSSETTLARMKKGISIRNIQDSVKDLKSNGFTVHASVIIGYPMETREDVKKSILFARSIKADYLSINILFCYPGTMVFNEALTAGLTLKDLSWEKFSQNISVPFGPQGIPDRDLKKYQLFGYAYFYSNIFKLMKLSRTFGIRQITKGLFRALKEV